MENEIKETKEIKEKIEQIVSEITVGYVFDAHVVTSQLEENYADTYKEFVGPDEDTPIKHGLISKIIDKLPNTKLLGKNFYSKNINGNFSTNAYWEKLD